MMVECGLTAFRLLCEGVAPCTTCNMKQHVSGDKATTMDQSVKDKFDKWMG